jgi:hypothetical protein
MTDPTDLPEVHPRVDPDLTVDASVLAGHVVAAPPIPGSLNIRSSAGEPLVSIDLGTGQITYGPGYTPDEAARLFWDAITRQHTAPERHFGRPLADTIDQHLRDGEAAERKVRRLDEMAEAWKALPATLLTASVVEAIHMVTRPDGERP